MNSILLCIQRKSRIKSLITFNPMLYQFKIIAFIHLRMNAWYKSYTSLSIIHFQDLNMFSMRTLVLCMIWIRGQFYKRNSQQSCVSTIHISGSLLNLVTWLIVFTNTYFFLNKSITEIRIAYCVFLLLKLTLKSFSSNDYLSIYNQYELIVTTYEYTFINELCIQR